MPLFLDTRGKSNLAVGICDRCRKKVPQADLRPDGNQTGLMVCSDECSDGLDRYKLPPRASERISLNFVRPDEPLV